MKLDFYRIIPLVVGLYMIIKAIVALKRYYSYKNETYAEIIKIREIGDSSYHTAEVLIKFTDTSNTSNSYKLKIFTEIDYTIGSKILVRYKKDNEMKVLYVGSKKKYFRGQYFQLAIGVFFIIISQTSFMNINNK